MSILPLFPEIFDRFDDLFISDVDLLLWYHGEPLRYFEVTFPWFKTSRRSFAIEIIMNRFILFFSIYIIAGLMFAFLGRYAY